MKLKLDFSTKSFSCNNLILTEYFKNFILVIDF